jgi:hypothetical protein
MHELFPLLISGFGVIVTLIGIVLFSRSRTEGKNRIKMLGVEAELSTPSLVIFVLGVFLTVFPWVHSSGEPIEPSEKELGLALLELSCVNASGFLSSGTDSPFIELNGERIWGPEKVECPTPEPIPLGGIRPVRLARDNNRIELWESDASERRTRGNDDRLGTSRVSLEPGPQTASFTEDSGHYILSWQVVFTERRKPEFETR